VTKKRNKNRRRSAHAIAHKSLREVIFESDSTYLFKLISYTIVATLWLKFGQPLRFGGLSLQALPLGLFAGLLAVRLIEARQLDRKIMYAMVMTMGILTYFVPAGIVI
jgi:hypothetical protein